MRWMLGLLAVGALTFALGCGGDDGGDAGGGQPSDALGSKLVAAQRPAVADFPPARGKTLQEIADGVKAVRAGLPPPSSRPGQTGSPLA